MKIRLIVFGSIIAATAIAQQSTFTFNNGQPYSLQASAGTETTFALSPASLQTNVPQSALIAIQNTPWLSVGVLQPNGSCDDGTVQYLPQNQAQIITTNALLCFEVTSASQSTTDPNYLAQGWYTGYLQVNFTGGATVVLPISLQVIPVGYLHLQDVNGNSLDGSSAAIDTTAPGGLAINASVNTNNPDDGSQAPPAHVSFTFSAQDSTSGLPPAWLNITGLGGAAISSPQTTSFTFYLSVNPSHIPPGATSLAADFVVKSTDGYQDTSVVHVTVSNIPSPCTYSFSGSQALPLSAGSGSVNLTTQVGCSWTASSDAAWLHISGAASELGSGTISYTYDANNGAGRTGDIVVSGKTFTVTQASGQSTSVQFESAASFLSGPVAAGSIVSAYGADLSNTALGATGALSTTLGGTTVSIVDASGASALAPLIYVSPGQVNLVVPSGTAIGNASVTVSSGDGTTSFGTAAIVAVEPGLFVFNASGLIAAYVITVDASGNQVYSSVFQQTAGSLVPLPVDLGQPSQSVFLVLYGTGIANRSSLSNVSVQIGGLTVPAQFAGPSDYLGEDQVNIQLPSSLAGAGNTPITVTADGVTSNTAYITIK